MDEASALDVVRSALHRFGLRTIPTNDRDTLQVLVAPGGPVAWLRMKGGFWLLDEPASAGARPRVHALGRVAMLDVETLVAAVHDKLGNLLAEGRASSSAPANALAAEVLARLRPALTAGGHLGGFLRAELMGVEPYLRLDTRTGVGFTVTVGQNRVWADVAGMGGERIPCCVGLVGRPYEATALRLIAATHEFSDASSRRGSLEHHDLDPLAEALAGPFGAHFEHRPDARAELVVPDTATHRGACLLEIGRVICADVGGIVEVFGTASSQRTAEIAEEVIARLSLSSVERDALAADWAVAGEELTARVERVSAAAHATEDGDVTAVAEQTLVDLGRLQTSGGGEALAEAHVVVAYLEEMVERPPSPAPRLIRQWADAEQVAAEWMEWFGFGPARLTGGSADGGVDVECDSAVGQVKDYGNAVAAGPVREIYAIASVMGKEAVIFARSGFTADAARWGDEARVAMFVFDLQGTPTPIGSRANELMGQ